jgi:hypothetical protein
MTSAYASRLTDQHRKYIAAIGKNELLAEIRRRGIEIRIEITGSQALCEYIDPTTNMQADKLLLSA